MGASQASFIAELKRIIGAGQVITGERASRRFTRGFRCGGGPALAVVRPRSLLDLWRALNACVAANKVVIPQAANTGLTGGSTPAPDGYDRDAVIISMTQLSKLYVIEGGRQVICLPGTTLHQLERALKPYGREPHSVIGSSCIGASVIGGICNSSGGSLVRRGPAYTEMALFARLTEGGRLELVNHLGVNLGNEPEEILGRLDRGEFADTDIDPDLHRSGSDLDYVRRVREVDSSVPARFNADPRRLFEAAGSAGRLIVFAVRLDTFPKDAVTRVFYIGTNDPKELTDLRRHGLSTFQNLPVAGEYLHRDAFDVAEQYGKDTFLAIQLLGTGFMPQFFRLKEWLSGLGCPSDRLLQSLARMFPSHLPVRLKEYRARYEHHLLLKMADEGIGEARRHLSRTFPSARGDFFECTPEEGEKAFLHRFAAAGAAIRYRALHTREVEDIVALDVALRPNDAEWFDALPPEVAPHIHRAVYYGHFFCHVFHWDYLVKSGSDPEWVKERLLQSLDARGAEYPAEHNVGHLYRAKPPLAKFYQHLDPTNTFNPGIGMTSKRANWK
jgi:D-lactate dehydrogenase